MHIVHSYDRIVPYIGHKKLTVVTLPPKVHSTSQSILRKEYDWIENKLRPWVGYSATNRYLNSDSSVVSHSEISHENSFFCLSINTCMTFDFFIHFLFTFLMNFCLPTNIFLKKNKYMKKKKRKQQNAHEI